MEPPELTNFGSLVRFALQLEAETAALYRTAGELVRGGAGADLARELADQHENRRKLLERTRQQKLNEMVLEPISGLDGARYVIETALSAPNEIGGRAARAEDVANLFYVESAIVAKSLLTEAARTFQKLAEENVRNSERVRKTFPS